MKLRTWLEATVFVLVILLVAVTSPQADEVGDVTSGVSYNFDRPARGFVRIIGEFSSAAPLDLGAQGVKATLHNLLLEADDPAIPGPGGELVVDVPLDLLPRTSSQRVTVFETKPGATPFARLVVRTCIPTREACPNASGLDVGEYTFRIDAVNVTVDQPTQCGPPPGPGTTEMSTKFTIDDGVSPPVTVLVDKHPWNCFFQNTRVNIIRAQ